MRCLAPIAIGLLLFVGVTLSAAADVPTIGLSVETLKDPNLIACPYCHKAIVPGRIHNDAQDTIATEIGGYLDEKGISHNGMENAIRGLNVFIYRYQQRVGGALAVEKRRQRRAPRTPAGERQGGERLCF
jgi:hypothetical protein